MALSCAFVGYCGPFNQEFRDHLVKTRFSDDLVTRGIPLTKGLGLTSFLVDMGTIGDWNLDGLPTDPLSIQNGILVSLVGTYSDTLSPAVQFDNFRPWRHDENVSRAAMLRVIQPLVSWILLSSEKVKVCDRTKISSIVLSAPIVTNM